ncbi:MAG: DUF4129 domain-containing protein [Firmicutes bacterium]|nr:DUF4129 domain-containing protein [Bacillota bacterium]
MSIGIPRLRGATVSVEGFYLPVTAALAATGVAAVTLRLIALATELNTGWLVYMALFIAGSIGVGAGTWRDLLDLPRTLRLLDLFIALTVGAGLLYLGPRTSGTLYIGGASQQVSLIGAGMTGVILAWACGSWLALVVAKVYPQHLARPESEVLAERLSEQARLQEHLTFRRSMSANIAAWRNGLRITLALILVYLAMTLVWTPLQKERGDILLAVWTSVAFGGVLAFLGLIHLAGNRRLEERSDQVLVLPGYSQAWAWAVYGLLLVIAVVGIALPSDISPLAYVDWNAVMTNFTQWLVSWAFTPPARRAAYEGLAGTMYGPSMGSMPLVGGGMGGAGPMGLIVVAGVFLAVYIIWYGIRKIIEKRDYLLEEERERSHGLFAILWAIITWPWRAFRRWWRALFFRDQAPEAASQKEKEEILRRSRRRRRPGARVHPEDPALFVRYVYGRLLYFAARAGFNRPKHQTALEYAELLSDRVPEAAEPVQELTRSYIQVRYTERKPDEGIRSRSVRLLRNAARGLRSMRRFRKEF